MQNGSPLKDFCLENTWLIIRWNIISLMWCHQYIVHDNSLFASRDIDERNPRSLIRDRFEKKERFDTRFDRPPRYEATQHFRLLNQWFFCKPNWWFIVILSPVFWTSDCDTVYIVTGVVGRQPRAFKI